MGECPEPEPGPGQVKVRVTAAGVTRGDARMRAMDVPPGFGLILRLLLGLRRPRRAIMGSEFVGVIEALGPGATRFASGDRVMGLMGLKGGAHAEALVIAADGLLVPAPGSLSDEEAAGFFFGGLTAADFLIDKAQVRRGERVLINGASGAVGSAAMQIARHLGAEVTAVCGAENAALARGLGADEVLDYRAGPLAGVWDVIMDIAGTLPWPVARDLLASGGRKPKLIFASSLAVYGGPSATVVTDATTPTPMSSYGVQKLCSEYLVGDYDRRGLIDGRALRFPTIAVRPGKANMANSSFISAVIREPVAGRDTVCPVPDDVPIALMSPDRLIEAILTVHDLPTEQFGWPRSLVLPAVKVTVREMLDALQDIVGPQARARVRFEPSERIVPMVRSWPAEVTSMRAAALGIVADTGARTFVEQYVAEFPPLSQQ